MLHSISMPVGPVSHAGPSYITYLALRHTRLQGRVLRSRDPESLKQEMGPLPAPEREGGLGATRHD